MDTLVLSDLHLSAEGAPGFYAGGEALPRLLARTAARSAPARIVLNGDTFDFLTAEGEPALAAEQARAAMQELARSRDAAPVLRQLGAVLAAGGEVIIRLGNHDLELALPPVQEVVRAALEQPPAIAARLCFMTGDRPLLLTIGGARILVTHGEHDDPFNRIDYPRLLRGAAGGAKDAAAFRYPPGTLLMRRIVGPIRSKYGLRFLDFLKPDFQGAALVALAVAPEAFRELFQAASWDIGWHLLRSSGSGLSFAPGEGTEPDLGLAERLAAGLSLIEEDELRAFAAPETEVSFSASPGRGAGLSQGLRAKLLRAGLSLYARAHRAFAGRSGADFFSLRPGDEERSWARELGRRYAADAVLTGHTHAARFDAGAGCVYINSGTWIWLVRLPAPEADLTEWTAWLSEMRQNPELLPERQERVRTERLLTVITARELAHGGASLALAECHDDGSLAVLRDAELPPRTGRQRAPHRGP